MKLYHFIILFAIIALAITFVLDIQTADLKAVVNNKEHIDQCLDTAIDDGATSLIQVDNNNNLNINKYAALDSFFVSLYSSFDIISDKDEIQKMDLYIPVVTVTMNDGYYIYYSDTYKSADGKAHLIKKWSEKFPYYYEDSDFIYGFTLEDKVNLYDKNKILDSTGGQTVYKLDFHDLQTKEEYADFRSKRPGSILLSNEAFNSIKKDTFITCIENTMAYYTSRHNSIASQYGITYDFSLPAVGKDEWDYNMQSNSMFVVFQGYPYGDETGETYNRIASAAAKITKNDVYYLEQVGWYLIYHKSTCPKLKESGIISSEEPYYSVEACAIAGAYACPYCSKGTGVYAPDYTP
jgi:hypothetical protein